MVAITPLDFFVCRGLEPVLTPLTVLCFFFLYHQWQYYNQYYLIANSFIKDSWIFTNLRLRGAVGSVLTSPQPILNNPWIISFYILNGWWKQRVTPCDRYRLHKIQILVYINKAFLEFNHVYLSTMISFVLGELNYIDRYYMVSKT